MIKIEATSVYDALYQTLENLRVHSVFNNRTRKITVRGMETIEFCGPYVTHYLNPRYRVLDWVVRKANPFFHLMEALWILRGRYDVAFLRYFNSNIANYSDDGITFNAPYGYRLRSHFDTDQIAAVIELLSEDPNSRQAVMSIWDPNRDLRLKSKDIPCNDIIFLKVREGLLHMTVSCRSNDMIWGAYGANVVQFSVLQEYIAAMIHADVGTYTQISDSMHVYTDNPVFKPMMLLSEELLTEDVYNIHADETVSPFPLVGNPATFDTELKWFLNWVDQQIRAERREIPLPLGLKNWSNPFFASVAIPMVQSWTLRKMGARGEAMLAPLNEQRESVDWIRASKRYLGFLEKE